RCVAGARLNPMNEERGTRDDRRAEAGPGPSDGHQAGPGPSDGHQAGPGPSDGHQAGPGPSDGHQAGPALERGGHAPGRAGAGSWAGADAPAGTGVRGEPAPPGQQSGKRSKSRSWWIELPILLAFALVLALLIKTFVVQAFFIPSSSMENTLQIGDKVLVNK